MSYRHSAQMTNSARMKDQHVFNEYLLDSLASWIETVRNPTGLYVCL